MLWKKKRRKADDEICARQRAAFPKSTAISGVPRLRREDAAAVSSREQRRLNRAQHQLEDRMSSGGEDEEEDGGSDSYDGIPEQFVEEEADAPRKC